VLALAFNAGIYIWKGPDVALEFLAGYVIERSLSVDNLFVFIMVFAYFNIEALHQHKILFWGILGALIMRAIFIIAGVTLVEQFDWIVYIFGAFLVYTSVKMVIQKDKEVCPDDNFFVKLARRFIPVASDHDGGKFFIKKDNVYLATVIFISLVFIEATDVVFAVDSIPAVLAVTTDPFIVYTSNVFAILGMRALYFALAGIMPMFYYLQYGLAATLAFVGAKMLLSGILHIPIIIALAIIIGILTVAIAASLLRPQKA
jgi:tellurite resistance protein TerC